MLQEKILDFMRHEAYRPLSAEDLAEALEIKGEELTEFWVLLDQMEHHAQIIRTRYDKFGVPERMNLVVGTLSMTSKGFGFVIPDVKNSEEETDVFIPVSALNSAMNNDRVVVRLHGAAGIGKAREGEIIRIITRANKRIVGTFESSKSFGFVTADDPKIGQDIFIPKASFNGAKIGAKVVVEITKWPENRRSAEGKVIEVIGYIGDPGIDILTVIKKHDLPLEFPAKVVKESENVPETIDQAEITGRRDLREFSIVTIDGDDAKDLDDGVYVEKREDGTFFLSVHIADVSYYVRENTALDYEAKNRGTSVYLVDRVIPMLPKRLSNGICSLNAGEDRLAMSIEMIIDPSGNVQKYEIFPSVIQVYRRLTYNIVRKILVDRDEALTQDNQDILPMLHNLEAICHVLRQRRMNRGAIDFDFPEIKVNLDEAGKPVKLVKRERNLAESIIEECMLVANETVAEHMFKLKLPFMYRVHEQPGLSKLEKLKDLLKSFGLSLPSLKEGEEIQPAILQKILKATAGKPEERIISTVMLRSLKQARYESQNLGHFGLAAKYYTHFTSPIRRYPDLIVHRLLRENFNGLLKPKRQDKLKTILPDIALSSSQRERLAAEAERETVEMKKVEYMQQFIGEEFDGIINGVTAFGIFVELDNGVEGLVRVSSMENDYYQYVEEQYALVGERTKKVYRLGDPAKIIVVNANVEDKTIDFILADNGTFRPVAPKKTRSSIRNLEIQEEKQDERKEKSKKKKSGAKWYESAPKGKGRSDKKKCSTVKRKTKTKVKKK